MAISDKPFSTSAPPVPTWSWLSEHPARMIAFGFGSGLAPVAPGTVGTLWAWVIGLFIVYGFEPTPTEMFMGLILGFVIGIIVCGLAGKDICQPDHGGMVWDEVIAFWIIMAFIMPASIWMQFLAFGIFRWLDAAKPGPIKIIDQYFKTWMPKTPFEIRWELAIRGFGVMIDDLAAAMGTLLLLAIIYRIFL
jgi:phosphatidylglycerophosphatase A